MKKKLALFMLVSAVLWSPFCKTAQEKPDSPDIDIPDPDNPVKETESGTPDEEAASESKTTEYYVTVGKFEGVLRIVKRDGAYSGTIQFASLGKGRPEEMKKLSIRNRLIYFERSVNNAKEMNELGASRLYRQVYRGEFTADGMTIKGTFSEAGALSSWEARKK